MNRQEQLFVVLSEEAVEIAEISLRISKVTHKLLRFGLDSSYPDTTQTNRDELVKECNDLFATLQLLIEAGVELPGLLDPLSILAKKEKVMHYLKVSKDKGTLK